MVRDSSLCAWLPQYHDFGLICSIFTALWGCGELTLMSPLTFVKRPAIWLEVMEAVKATHTASPNFGFELLLRKTSRVELSRFDLSSVQQICQI